VKNPPPPADAKAASQDRQVHWLPGLHVVGEGFARGRWTAAHLRPAAREHRQQDNVRGVFNWVRDPKHYNPDTYMPQPAADRRQAADVARI